MIGQSKLLNKINSFNLDNFPRSVLLLGKKGCGKHLLCNIIKDKLNLPLFDITETVSSELLDNIYRTSNPAIYIVDLSKFLFEKNQNIILKFVEEPLLNSFIILLAETRLNVLDTVYNRCRVFEFEEYKKDELAEFISDNPDKELILNIVKTPGQILESNIKNISQIYDTCDKLADKLDRASYQNTLTVANKINYSDEYDKYDLDIFLDTLIFILFNKYLEKDNIKLYKMYLLTVDQRKHIYDKRVNKSIFLQNYLTKLWKEARK